MLIITLLLQLLTTFTPPATTPVFPTEPPKLYRSTDLGNSWIPFAEGLPDEASPSKIAEDQDRLYLATHRNGVYVLTPGANRWEARNQGLSDLKPIITSLVVRDDFVAFGTYHGKVFTSTDGGLHWQRPVFNFMGGSVRALFIHEGWLIAGTDNGSYRSADDGMTWQQTGDLVQVNDIAYFNGRLYAARRDGIVVSDDAGQSWSVAYSEWTVNSLLLSGDKLYGKVMGDKVIRTRDGGFWERPIMALPGSHPADLPTALWGGFRPEAPNGLTVGSLTETSRGWVMGIALGC